MLDLLGGPITSRRGRGAMALVLAVALLAPAAALAAHPRKGAHFTGSVAGVGINGFKAPVGFKVSSNGSTLTGFTFSTLGCFGAGGFQPGVDYFTKSFNVYKLGTLKSVGSHYSASKVALTRSGTGYGEKTTASASVSFSSPTEASGTITYTQKLSGSSTAECGPATLQFTAKG